MPRTARTTPLTAPERKRLLADCARIAASAAERRGQLRRRTRKGTEARESLLALTEREISEVMARVRSEMGRRQYASSARSNDRFYSRLADASAELQAERRKIWKMRQRKDADA